jgi:hypothetical protein
VEVDLDVVELRIVSTRRGDRGDRRTRRRKRREKRRMTTGQGEREVVGGGEEKANGNRDKSRNREKPEGCVVSPPETGGGV